MATSISIDLCGNMSTDVASWNFDSARQSTATSAPPSAANVTRSTAPLRTSSKNSLAAHRWSAGAALARLATSAVVNAAAAARRLFAWRRVLERGGARRCGGKRSEKAETSLPRRSRASAAPRVVVRGMVGEFTTAR